jgi:hypothetical protein
VLTRTRRKGIRPIEIGRQIIATMDNEAEVNSGQVAHRYAVGLHKSDLAALSDSIKPLLSELRQAITNHAQFEGYTLSGDAEVVFVEDVAMRSQTLRRALEGRNFSLEFQPICALGDGRLHH